MRAPTSTTNVQLPKCGIVIVLTDEHKVDFINNTLRYCIEQDYPNVNILVVDARTNSDMEISGLQYSSALVCTKIKEYDYNDYKGITYTTGIYENGKYTGTFRLMDIIRVPHQSNADLKNLGLSHIITQWPTVSQDLVMHAVGFIEPPTEMYDDCISECIANLLEQPSFGAIYGDYYLGKYGITIPQMIQPHSEQSLYQGYRYYPCPIFNINVFMTVGGFDPQLSIYEDFDMMVRVATRFPICHIPKILSYTKHKDVDMGQVSNMCLQYIYQKLEQSKKVQS